MCARLTLFNARRGGEPCRLKIQIFEDAMSERWLDKKVIEKLNDSEQEIFKNMKIGYQTGKGNHLVPILFPADTIPALKLLTSYDVRQKVSVNKDNKYIFANTNFSCDHVGGWAAINKMAESAGVSRPELLTATRTRHRISTLYAELDVADKDRQVFYKHMGHSEKVNQHTYQQPLPIQEMLKVGTQLEKFDRGRQCCVHCTY